jgi:hypothetical protein
MSNYNDVMMMECADGHEAQTELEYYQSVQRVINAGQWGLQGSFGRTMMGAISSGRCLLGPNPARDYYGNRIPSRTGVEEGTKGSRQFVVDEMGEEWAKSMEEVQ